MYEMVTQIDKTSLDYDDIEVGQNLITHQDMVHYPLNSIVDWEINKKQVAVVSSMILEPDSEPYCRINTSIPITNIPITKKLDVSIIKKPVRIRRKLSEVSGEELRLWIRSLKERCVICGETDSVILSYHHKDPKQKRLNISSMAARRFLKAEILEEIKKCVILCPNCHMRIHRSLNFEDLLN